MTIKINDIKASDQATNPNYKMEVAINQLQQLIDTINQRKIPEVVATKINYEVSQIDTALITRNALRAKQTKILKILEKDLKIVPLNYYRNLWLALGMTAFGLPIGIAIAMSLGNIGLLGIGLPIGIALGMAVGTAMDKKARQEGRQLALEVR